MSLVSTATRSRWFAGDGSGLVRHRQALLDQSRQALLAHALAPARQRRAIERGLVPEHVLAAEELVIGGQPSARTAPHPRAHPCA